MSEPQTPDSPTPSSPGPSPKKKFSPLAWVLVGCLVILLLGALLTFTCTAFVAKKVKDVADELSENPAMAAAEIVVKVNPDLELVDKDEESQTLTIRNKETGETMTFDLEDVTEGRFRWKTGDQEVIIDAGASDEEGGLITVTDQSGDKETLNIGRGSAQEIPSWVPVYPGAEAQAPFLMTSEEGIQGTLSFETDDSVAAVTEYYLENLEQAGFKVEKTSFSSDNLETRMLSASADGEKSLYVNITAEGGAATRVGINFSTAQ